MTARKRIAPTDEPLREVRTVVQKFYDIFPSCETPGCYDLADTRSKFCNRCSSEREWEARRASMRAAREAMSE